MFTGLVAAMGEAVSLGRRPGGAVLRIRATQVASDAAIGDSIAISGVCLTVTGIDSGAALSFDLSDETLQSSTLGALRPGERLNLEPSLRPDSKLGGHFVTGHVDAVGKVRSRNVEGDNFRFVIEAPAEVFKYLVPKGSVTIDGISLTVVEVLDGAFSVVIIPHTAQVTTMGARQVGDAVNLEADILGKYVVKFLSNAYGGKDPSSLMDKLAGGGFLD